MWALSRPYCRHRQNGRVAHVQPSSFKAVGLPRRFARKKHASAKQSSRQPNTSNGGLFGGRNPAMTAKTKAKTRRIRESTFCHLSTPVYPKGGAGLEPTPPILLSRRKAGTAALGSGSRRDRVVRVLPEQVQFVHFRLKGGGVVGGQRASSA